MAADDIAPDIVRRINDAADQLFDESGRNALPNVDAVRRRAHANMNHATLVMRAWRAQHKPQPPSTEEVLPDALQQQSAVLIASFWRAARAIASDHLAIAQAAWDTEKAEQEELRAQLAAAFDAQSTELHEAATARAKLHDEAAALARQNDALEQRAISAETESTTNARVLRQAQSEIAELRKLLGTAQAATDQLAQQLSEQITRHAAVTERNLAEQTRYAEQLGQARQEAAELRLRLTETTTPTSPGAPNAIIKKQSGKALSTRQNPVESKGE